MLVCDDALRFLSTLGAGSVDLLLTDPPYASTRNAWDVPFDLESFWLQARRVCSRGAAVVVFADMRFAARLIASNERGYRYDWVWRKNLASGHLSARHRPLRAHEHVLVFSLDGRAPRYFPQKSKGKPARQHAGKRQTSCYGPDKRIDYVNETGDRQPRSVLSFRAVHNGSPERVHPTQKPDKLLRRLVLTYSEPGHVVCDPFAGSGSTGVAALALGRGFVGCELDPSYHAIASERLRNVSVEAPIPCAC